MNEQKDLITNIEEKELDKTQTECVNSEERNILAIAGAGCGKTTTLLARVKYLIEKRKANKEDILILSFTNSSTNELKERIRRVTHEDIDVFTFHKLGKSIINSVDGYDVTLYKNGVSKFVSQYLDIRLKKGKYYEFYDFLINHYHEYVPFKSFDKKEHEYKYLKEKAIISLDNEYKMTFEENVISNYLFLHKINYEYFMTNPLGDEFRKLCSGFYLPDYDLYIFNLYIDKEGNKPLWGYPKNKRVAQKNYDAYINFLNTYPGFKDKCIFTYSYDFENNQFADKLNEELDKYNIKRDFSYDDIDEEISRVFAYNISFIKKLIANFITLMKTTARKSENVLKIDNYYNKAEEIRSKSFYKLVLPIYEAYEKILYHNNQIDFNDMILKATDYVNKGLYLKDYKYILIDEFQDISSSRMRLVDSIYRKSESEIFAVGDDYQSIFRFTGSDINIFYDFEKEYNAKKYLIENNYRFDSNIANLSNKFILQNPHQIKKELKSKRAGVSSVEFVTSPNKNNLTKLFLDKLYSLPIGSEVMLLGRYKKDILRYAKTEETEITINEEKEVNIKLIRRPDLNINFMTVHKAKGLECDYVFILNTFNNLMGFPCNITDDNLIKLLLKNKENFLYAEERRLFYVAMTRAKEKLFIMVDRNSLSPFVEELMEYKINK
ncbi:UvrD-helicase domain-containing protein [Anaerofustis stercorihominis]|uniref:UvrD-helicase domain-containing protein n=1 Tax=Anaerofustis stercorihominis TaxID=214853 RepID=UPI00210C7147|nr:UvrD-helicase domain-containing protein [Anaerofustis stercorihominis]MCQ4796119.1 UvrD-helicase domain-containing protein [Anaerofustis stercorihominis]